MYHDLESLLPPIPTNCRDPNAPYMNLINQHISCGWNVRSKFAYGEVKDPETSYRGSDCIKTLCEHFIPGTHRLYKSFPERHLFIKELVKHFDDIGVISINKEEYITFSVKIPVDKYLDKNGDEKDKFMELRFIDSFKFMATSLDSLTRNLVSSGKRLSGFENYSESQYKLLTKKGIYPYEYITSWDRFDKTKLPLIEAFYSSLNMSGVSESDYQHAQIVWTDLTLRTLGNIMISTLKLTFSY